MRGRTACAGFTSRVPPAGWMPGVWPPIEKNKGDRDILCFPYQGKQRKVAEGIEPLVFPPVDLGTAA